MQLITLRSTKWYVHSEIPRLDTSPVVGMTLWMSAIITVRNIACLFAVRAQGVITRRRSVFAWPTISGRVDHWWDLLPDPEVNSLNWVVHAFDWTMSSTFSRDKSPTMAANQKHCQSDRSRSKCIHGLSGVWPKLTLKFHMTSRSQSRLEHAYSCDNWRGLPELVICYACAAQLWMGLLYEMCACSIVGCSRHFKSLPRHVILSAGLHSHLGIGSYGSLCCYPKRAIMRATPSPPNDPFGSSDF